ncbi:MAG TPA: hypothetical protein VHG28_20210 [Longimicrobiaceae bacterium]|nr:hypothetical protein [Longimicrobiaceae bacterium]
MRHWPVCLFLLLLLGAQSLEAQCSRLSGRRYRECRERMERSNRSRSFTVEPVQFGVRGGYDFEEDVGLAGAQIRIPLAPQIAVSPSADVFFGDDEDGDGTEWQLNADLLVRPYALGGLYGGIGVAFMNRDFDPDDFDEDSETEVGYNLLVGIESGPLSGSTLRPFAEARWTGIDDYIPFRLVAGFNVPISGGRF